MSSVQKYSTWIHDHIWVFSCQETVWCHCSQTVTWKSCMMKIAHLVIDLVISACWETAGMKVALHWCVAFIEPIVPLLNLHDAHGIVAPSLSYLPNSFHLGITKLLDDKIWCSTNVLVALLFCRRDSLTGRLPATSVVSWQEKWILAWKYPSLSCIICFHLKNSGWVLLNRLCSISNSNIYKLSLVSKVFFFVSYIYHNIFSLKTFQESTCVDCPQYYWRIVH